MKRTAILATIILAAVGLFVSACGGGGAGGTGGTGDTGAGGAPSGLKEIQKQRAGDYVVSVLSDSGQLKVGKNSFVIEVRKAADNELAEAGAVQVNSKMPMPGMSPMIAEVSAAPSGTPGRYDATATFTMAGTYNSTIKLGSGQTAQLALKVQ